MGEGTFDSLPGFCPAAAHRPYPRLEWRAEGVETARSVDEALAMAGEPVSVIGGAEIIASFLRSPARSS